MTSQENTCLSVRVFEGSEIIETVYYRCVGRVAQSVQLLTTGYTVGDRIPVGTRFSARPDRPLGPKPASCKMGIGSFPGGRGGRGVGLTPHPHLVPKVLEKSRAIPLLTLRVRTHQRSRVEFNPVQPDSRIKGCSHGPSRVQSSLRESQWVFSTL